MMRKNKLIKAIEMEKKLTNVTEGEHIKEKAKKIEELLKRISKKHKE